jgi:hypothetical protein
MTMKKMLLLAGMALAAIAFAAPAAQAEGPSWYSHASGSDVLLEEPEEFAMHGTFSSQGVGSGLVTGPCTVEFEGTAFNENGMAGGNVEVARIQEECGTNLPNCRVKPTLNQGSLPWDLTGVTITGQQGAEITTPTFTNHYTAGCAAFGLPTEISADGITTGILTSASCLTFNEHLDDMFIEVGGVTTATRLDLLGNGCIESPLTLK